MRTIHKYTLDVSNGQRLLMPRNADVLCAQMQDGLIRLWAVVDDKADMETRIVDVIGTGWEMPSEVGRSDYIGTIQAGRLVWHVFVQKPSAFARQA
jgi:hypothetical protein